MGLRNRDPVYRSLLTTKIQDIDSSSLQPKRRNTKSTYSTSLVQIFNSSSESLENCTISVDFSSIFTIRTRQEETIVDSIKIHCTRKNNLLLSTSSPPFLHFIHSKRKEKRRLLIINRFKIFRASKNHKESILNPYDTIFISL